MKSDIKWNDDDDDHKLLYKLKQLGIDGRVHQWITNWLSNIQQRVVIDGFNSVGACH